MKTVGELRAEAQHLRDLATRVAAWTRANLIDPHTGRTYFQKHGIFTDRRSFVRWGDGHWALAQGSLALLAAGRQDPFEAAVAACRTKEGVVSPDPLTPGGDSSGGQT